mgnify:CR=1 FL=1
MQHICCSRMHRNMHKLLVPDNIPFMQRRRRMLLDSTKLLRNSKHLLPVFNTIIMHRVRMQLECCPKQMPRHIKRLRFFWQPGNMRQLRLLLGFAKLFRDLHKLPFLFK